MRSTHAIAFLLLVVGLSVLLLTSCGEDKGTGPICHNCDYWQKAFGGVGRFPAVSPTDSRAVAFVSTRTDTGNGIYNHIWVAKLGNEEGDTTHFYQITSDDFHDFKPAWSPDGQTIAFERNFGGSRSDIYTVDASSLESPGAPVQFTDRVKLPQANFSPAWVVLGGHTWLAFSNLSGGGNDYDLGMYRYPEGDSLTMITLDPSDFARNENGILAATFKDQQVCGNGSSLLAFASPDRVKVCDIRVVARSAEHPDTSAVAKIIIGGKDSGKSTPHIFRYRPSGVKVEVRGNLAGYCTEPFDSIAAPPDVTTTVLLDFVYYHGTVGFSSDPGTKLVYLDGSKLENLYTRPAPTSFVYVTCVAAGAHSAYAANVTDEQACSPTENFEVVAGETTLVTFDCTGALHNRVLAPSPHSGALAAPPVTSRSLAVVEPNGVWLLDLKTGASTDDDRLYRVEASASSICEPALSPDGKYVAYIRGEERSRELVVSDLSGLLAGSGPAEAVVIGLPGSSEDVECWRIPERLAWSSVASERKLVASLSVCRGGAVPGDYEIWIADLSRFLD
ncbi:MAG: hypothetical protein V1694_08285 [Candidatus Eisenbacteria bacterium]